MIPRSDMDAYSEALGRIGGSAEGAAVRAVRAVVAASRAQGLTVAETREQAKAVLEPVATAYGDVAAQLAAEFYDMCAAGGLDPAEVPAGDFADVVDSTVRYQIRKLMDGDAEGFARACGELARNVTGRRAAETAIRNARRDRGRGVRFARVPSGTETCAFCRMLASRGFVYWTKETAGALDHFHRGCDCMIVASNDPEGAEGYDPDRERELWKRFEEIDADKSLSRAERDAAKRAVLLERDVMHTYSDPAVEYFGPAELSHPEELEKLKTFLKSEGVELRRKDREAIAYSPSISAGKPGQLMFTNEMSWSAWLHESDHYKFDKELGFPGLPFFLGHPDLWDEMEQSAYGLEMDNARRFGYNELADRLSDLLERDKESRRA